jgi:hypothetical protein
MATNTLPLIFLMMLMIILLQHPNGVIAGYRLYYMTKKMTDVVTVKDSSNEIIYRLQSLGKEVQAPK